MAKLVFGLKSRLDNYAKPKIPLMDYLSDVILVKDDSNIVTFGQ